MNELIIRTIRASLRAHHKHLHKERLALDIVKDRERYHLINGTIKDLNAAIKWVNEQKPVVESQGKLKI